MSIFHLGAGLIIVLDLYKIVKVLSGGRNDMHNLPRAAIYQESQESLQPEDI